ncbi:unnamed protein product [Paramecium octaurelia]|uniref:Uncharacterized protein n=1 Tax=Paramecium octaurelia TaxID=43137 RepID=A0A8S1VIN2_PAROT|nr:unnamed protein product [Paramecium octaurelia]
MNQEQKTHFTKGGKLKLSITILKITHLRLLSFNSKLKYSIQVLKKKVSFCEDMFETQELWQLTKTVR